MALIQKIDSSDLYDVAVAWGRADSFGCKGWEAIGEYLEELSDDIGDVEIDIIAICCDYSMVESVEAFVIEYQEFMDEVDPETWGEMGEDDKLEAIRDYLQEKTSVVICENDCIIWKAF